MTYTISPGDRPRIRQICGDHGQIFTATLAKVYQDVRGDDNWKDVGVEGPLVFMLDHPPRETFALRILDLASHSIIWEQALPSNSPYLQETKSFHTFYSKSGRYGLSFVDSEEGNQFHQIVEKKRGSGTQFAAPTSSRQTSNAGESFPNPPLTKANIGSINISGPRNFRHVGHVGYSAGDGRIIVENVTPELKRALQVPQTTHRNRDVDAVQYPKPPVARRPPSPPSSKQPSLPAASPTLKSKQSSPKLRSAPSPNFHEPLRAAPMPPSRAPPSPPVSAQKQPPPTLPPPQVPVSASLSNHMPSSHASVGSQNLNAASVKPKIPPPPPPRRSPPKAVTATPTIPASVAPTLPKEMTPASTNLPSAVASPRLASTTSASVAAAESADAAPSEVPSDCHSSSMETLHAISVESLSLKDVQGTPPLDRPAPKCLESGGSLASSKDSKKTPTTAAASPKVQPLPVIPPPPPVQETQPQEEPRRKPSIRDMLFSVFSSNKATESDSDQPQPIPETARLVQGDPMTIPTASAAPPPPPPPPPPVSAPPMKTSTSVPDAPMPPPPPVPKTSVPGEARPTLASEPVAPRDALLESIRQAGTKKLKKTPQSDGNAGTDSFASKKPAPMSAFEEMLVNAAKAQAKRTAVPSSMSQPNSKDQSPQRSHVSSPKEPAVLPQSVGQDAWT